MPKAGSAETPGPAVAQAAIVALVYSDGALAGRLLQGWAHALRRAGYACAGLVQHDEPAPGRSRCDMVLENLRTGARVRISDDRGPHARGCRLDPDGLLTAMTDVRVSLHEGADVLLLSKFGKSESEGGGFRPLIADAVDRGISLVIGVPARNLASWRAFACGTAREIAAESVEDLDVAALRGLLRLQVR